MSDLNDLLNSYSSRRASAQRAFSLGVEALLSEVRRFAVAAESAIGEISVNEAWSGVERVVRERCEWLRGERDEDPR